MAFARLNLGEGMSSASTNRKRAPPARKSKSSPVVPVRDIAESARVLLAVAAGGRCEFPGCNRYLFEHPVTMKGGNYSQMAHIVAFSEAGPRGMQSCRPMDINAISNLMLLCQPCHKEIDDNPGDYPRSLLETKKKLHEARILHLTGLADSLKTTVVVFKALIGGDSVEISRDEIYEAIAPRWPVDRRGFVIDLTCFSQDTPEFNEVAVKQIRNDLASLLGRTMDGEKPGHLSLFALGPIPLLVALGAELSNKLRVDFFQRHREKGSTWKWQATGGVARFKVQKIRPGRVERAVAVLVDLSGPLDIGSLPAEINKTFPIYRLSLANQDPNAGFLRRRQDLENFRKAYRNLLATIMKDNPGVREIHLFPAMPAPVAVCCGHDLLPKVHPELLVYDRDKRKGGFNFCAKVNANETR